MDYEFSHIHFTTFTTPQRPKNHIAMVATSRNPLPSTVATIPGGRGFSMLCSMPLSIDVSRALLNVNGGSVHG